MLDSGRQAGRQCRPVANVIIIHSIHMKSYELLVCTGNNNTLIVALLLY